MISCYSDPLELRRILDVNQPITVTEGRSSTKAFPSWHIIDVPQAGTMSIESLSDKPTTLRSSFQHGLGGLSGKMRPLAMAIASMPYSEPSYLLNCDLICDTSPQGQDTQSDGEHIPLADVRWKERTWVEHEYPGFSLDIERIRIHKRDWGKEGTKNPSDETLDYAYEALHELAHYARSSGISLPEPSVGRCADGSILFEWDLDGGSFELEFSSEKGLRHCTFLLCPVDDDDSAWQEDEIVGSLAEHPAVRKFVSWFRLAR